MELSSKVHVGVRLSVLSMYTVTRLHGGYTANDEAVSLPLSLTPIPSP